MSAAWCVRVCDLSIWSSMITSPHFPPCSDTSASAASQNTSGEFRMAVRPAICQSIYSGPKKRHVVVFQRGAGLHVHIPRPRTLLGGPCTREAGRLREVPVNAFWDVATPLLYVLTPYLEQQPNYAVSTMHMCRCARGCGSAGDSRHRLDHIVGRPRAAARRRIYE